MGDIQKYYENTENALPHPMVKKFINMNSNPQYAIDLGCGAGRDTIYLIKNKYENHWFVNYNMLLYQYNNVRGE